MTAGGAALAALACPRCAAGEAARLAFWENAPLIQLLIALVPFVVVGLGAFAIARLGQARSAPEDEA
jgi:hypothetical protein